MAKRVRLLCGLALVQICVFDTSAAVESVSSGGAGLEQSPTEEPYDNDGLLKRSATSSRLTSDFEDAGATESHEEGRGVDEVDNEQGVEEDGSLPEQGSAATRRLGATEELDARTLSKLLQMASRSLKVRPISQDDPATGTAPTDVAPKQAGAVDRESGVDASLEKTRQAAWALANAATIFVERIGELLAKRAERPLAEVSGMANTVKTNIYGAAEKIGQVKDEVAESVSNGLSETLSSILAHMAKTNPEVFAQALELQKKLLALQGDVVGYADQIKDAAGGAAARAKDMSAGAVGFALDAAASGADFVSSKATLAREQLRKRGD